MLLNFKPLFQDKKQTAVIMQGTWDLLNIFPEGDHVEEDLFGILDEEDFTEDLTTQKKEEHTKPQIAAAKLALKEKKNKIEDNIVSPIRALSSVPKQSTECFGFSTPKNNTSSTQAEPMMRAQNEVPRMEADSQSQDDISVIYSFDDIAQTIKTEPEDRLDDEDVVRCDLTPTPVLKAVVRPESTEENPCNSTNDVDSSLRSDQKENTKFEEGFPGFSLLPQNSVVKESSNVVNSENLVAERESENVSAEEIVLEGKSSSTVCSTEANQSGSAPGSNDSFLEDDTYTKYLTLQQNGLFGMDGDGPNYFSEILDPNGDIFSSEGLNDNNISYWPSQDFFLGQYEDGIFPHYEHVGTSQFPDFYNDQQDLVFTEANILSPPMMDMIRDDPIEYQLGTTHFNDLSMMVSDTAPGTQTPEEAQDGPMVFFMDKPKKKGRGRKAVNKGNEKTSPKKWKSIFDPDPEPLTERKCKLKIAEGMFPLFFLSLAIMKQFRICLIFLNKCIFSLNSLFKWHFTSKR